jgi:hypothetical protein
MESCHKLTREDSHDRGPLPWFGGEDQERPADDAAAEAFDSLKGALHDPRRWGLSSGERLAPWANASTSSGNGFAAVSRPPHATLAGAHTPICGGS